MLLSRPDDLRVSALNSGVRCRPIVAVEIDAELSSDIIRSFKLGGLSRSNPTDWYDAG